MSNEFRGYRHMHATSSRHEDSEDLSRVSPLNVQPWDATGLNVSMRVTERKEDRGDLTGGSTDVEAVSATKGPSNEREKKKKGKKR